jgi:hypothetical protein
MMRKPIFILIPVVLIVLAGALVLNHDWRSENRHIPSTKNSFAEEMGDAEKEGRKAAVLLAKDIGAKISENHESEITQIANAISYLADHLSGLDDVEKGNRAVYLKCLEYSAFLKDLSECFRLPKGNDSEAKNDEMVILSRQIHNYLVNLAVDPKAIKADDFAKIEEKLNSVTHNQSIVTKEYHRYLSSGELKTDIQLTGEIR